MSSIAKTSISLSKKDLTKSRIPPIGTRNVVFYHKATAGDLTIDLLSLVMPSAEMPSAVQATPDELSSARLTINKKNLNLVSSTKGQLIQNLDYLVVDSSTINLIGPYESIGAEIDEIFIGTIVSVPISDLVTASSRNVVRSYTLPIGQTTLNVAQEFKVNQYSSENIGIVKVFVNGVLAFRNTGNSSSVLDKDYYEVDSGNGFGSTIEFNIAPISAAHNIIIDFGVQAITDFDAIGTIESLSGSVKKIADDLAVIAGTSSNDYIASNPSEVERRAFGDNVLDLLDRVYALENITKPTVQILTTGSGTYTRPASASYLKIKIVGGGGGGGGSGTGGYGSGGNGGDTSFGTALASGGLGGTGFSNNGGLGGAASLSLDMSGIAINGGSGDGCQNSSVTTTLFGGSGASSPFGGSGGGGSASAATPNAGYSAIANSGSGGGGGGAIGVDAANSGPGGGAGGYIEAIIANPSSSYVYSIGTGGAGGTAGVSGAAGGSGGSGVVIIEEYYN
jgi:hypothetical protein